MSTARTPDGTPLGLVQVGLRFAYADPPYPGCAYLYRDHPDYAGEVDHAELVKRLCRDYPDGWALSTSAPAIHYVLGLCPSDVRVAVWHRVDAAPPGPRPGWWWDWEPVIVRGGRPPGPVRTVLESGVGNRQFIGAKPPAFTRWMLALLGAEPTDTIDDLFPGSGAVAAAVASWRKQPVLPVFNTPLIHRPRRSEGRIARDLELAGEPELLPRIEIAAQTPAGPPQGRL